MEVEDHTACEHKIRKVSYCHTCFRMKAGAFFIRGKMKIAYSKNDICSRAYDDFTVIYDLRNRNILRLQDVAADV